MSLNLQTQTCFFFWLSFNILTFRNMASIGVLLLWQWWNAGAFLARKHLIFTFSLHSWCTFSRAWWQDKNHTTKNRKHRLPNNSTNITVVKTLHQNIAYLEHYHRLVFVPTRPILTYVDQLNCWANYEGANSIFVCSLYLFVFFLIVFYWLTSTCFKSFT